MANREIKIEIAEEKQKPGTGTDNLDDPAESVAESAGCAAVFFGLLVLTGAIFFR